MRFAVLVQKAAEICQEVKALGASLLAAMEKEDGEALQILRAQHEHAVLEAAESVKYGQVQEAIKNREALERSMLNAVERYTFYERLLGECRRTRQKFGSRRDRSTRSTVTACRSRPSARPSPARETCRNES